MDILEACARLERAGLIAGTSGNVSTRGADGKIVTTPAGRIKRTLDASELVTLREDGSPLVEDGPQPSSELAVHLEIYRQLAWVGAVVHAHPPITTALVTASKPINFCVSAEGATLGPIVLIPYTRPGTRALADACAAGIARGARLLLLEHHGAVCVGETLAEAQARMESLEHVAKILHAARLLGEPSYLNIKEVHALRALAGFDDSLPARVIS